MVFLCPRCDEDHPSLRREVEEAIEASGGRGETCCTVLWLDGQELSSVGHRRLPRDVACVCFVTDPFPGGSPARNRFYLYTTITGLLGTTSERGRVRLPDCVQDKIANTYPDVAGSPVKVGYKQS